MASLSISTLRSRQLLSWRAGRVGPTLSSAISEASKNGPERSNTAAALFRHQPSSHPSAQPMLYRRRDHPKPTPSIVSTHARTVFSALRSGRPEATGLGRDRRAFRTHGGGSVFPRRHRLFLEILHDEEVAAADQIPAKWKTTL